MTARKRRRMGVLYDRSTELPPEWGRRVTLCIGAISDIHGCSISVSDFMLSNPGTSTEAITVKAQWVPNAANWVQMFAGDMTVDARVCDYLRSRIASGSQPSAAEIESHFKAAYELELLRRIETEVLGTLGVTRE